ncbi:MAG: hypothetical protein WC569_05795 [Candidatus Omnitrophota bacterium]
MRELLFKNITSGNKKRRDLFLSETVERNGVKTTTRRHSIYIVEGTSKFDTLQELSEWKKNVDATNKRHVFILKKRDSQSKKDTFICDVVGKFYAVNEQDIYAIAFKHSFEIDFHYPQVT